MKKCFTIMFLIVIAILILSSNDAIARLVKVVVFPFDVYAKEDLGYIQSGLSTMISSRITVPGKITVVDNYVLKGGLEQKSQQYSLTEKRTLVKKLGADFFITGSITKIKDNISVDSLLVDVMENGDSTPVVIQIIRLSDIIPEIDNFSQKIKKIIFESPSLFDHVPSDKPLTSPEKNKKSIPVAISTEIFSENVPSERLRKKDRVKESSIEDPVEKDLEEYETLRSETPILKKLPPIFYSTPYFTYDIKSEPLHVLSTGDTDGDGKKELLIAGEERIFIYHVTDTTLTFCGEIKAQMDENIIHINTADINGNGIDEVYVSSYEGHYANSFVVENIKDSYQRIAESQRRFFRTYEPPGNGRQIIGQQAESTNPFLGIIDRLDWKNGKLITREEFIRPISSGIYSFLEGDIDADGNKEHIAFSRGLFSSKYRLTILSYTGRVKWRDLLKLGGSPNSFTKKLYGDDIEQQEHLPLRILCGDLNKDGRLELIVAKNSKKEKGFMEKLIDYNHGEVLCLHWDGSDLIANWTSGLFKDYVTDYVLENFDHDDRKELYILSVSEEGLFGKAKNRITVFKIASP